MKRNCFKVVAWLLIMCSIFSVVPVSLAEEIGRTTQVGGIPLINVQADNKQTFAFTANGDTTVWVPLQPDELSGVNSTGDNIPILPELISQSENSPAHSPLESVNQGGIPLITEAQPENASEGTSVLADTVPATELGIGEMNADGQYNRQYSNEAKTTVTAAQLLKLIQDGDQTATKLAKQLGFGYRTEDQIANLTKLVEEYSLFPDFIEPGFEIDDVNIKLDKEITEDTEDGLSGYRTTINVETTAAITIQYDERGETKIIRRVPSANPTDFVITLDVSGSMEDYGRDKAMFSALETLLKEIFEDPKNTASVIFWASSASVMRLDINQDGIIESTFSGENGITVSNMFESPLLDASGSPDSKNTSLGTYKTNTGWYNGIIGRIESLYRTNGGTSPDKGLQQAIDLLDAMNRADERNLGVLLFTDGDATYSSKTPTVELEKKLAEDYYAKVVNVSIGDEKQVERYREYLDPTSNNYRGGDDAVLQNRVVYYNIPNLTDEELAARVTAMFDTAFEEFTSEKVELKTETITTGIMAAVNVKLIETIPAGFEVHSTDGHTYTVDGVDEKGNTIISFQLDDLMAGQTQSVSYFTVPVSEDQDIGLTAYTENANTVLYAEPVNRIAQEQEKRGVEIVYNTLAKPAEPAIEEPIKSATLEAVGQSLVNHQFRITVVTDGSITRLSAKNNNDYPLQETWTKTYNPDGTITWVRVYNADVSDPNRYWTVTAWVGDTAVGSMQTNTLGIGDVRLTLTADKTTAMVGDKVTFTISTNAKTGIVSLLADGKYPLGTIDLSKNGRTIAWSFSNSGKRIISAYLDGVKVGSITVSIIDAQLIQEALEKQEQILKHFTGNNQKNGKEKLEQEYKDWWMKEIYPRYEWYVKAYRPYGKASDYTNLLRKLCELVEVCDVKGFTDISDSEKYQITLMNVAESTKKSNSKDIDRLLKTTSSDTVAKVNKELDFMKVRHDLLLDSLETLCAGTKVVVDGFSLKLGDNKVLDISKDVYSELTESLISALRITFEENYEYYKKTVQYRLFAEEYIKAIDNVDEMYIDYLKTTYFNEELYFSDSKSDYSSVYKKAAEELIKGLKFTNYTYDEKMLYAYRAISGNENLTMDEMKKLYNDSFTFDESNYFNNYVREALFHLGSFCLKQVTGKLLGDEFAEEITGDIEKAVLLAIDNNLVTSGENFKFDFSGMLSDIMTECSKMGIAISEDLLLHLFVTPEVLTEEGASGSLKNIYSIFKDINEGVTSVWDEAVDIKKLIEISGKGEFNTYANYLKDLRDYRRDLEINAEVLAFSKETFESMSAQELEARRQGICLLNNIDDSMFYTYKRMKEIYNGKEVKYITDSKFFGLVPVNSEYKWLTDNNYSEYTELISKYRDIFNNVPSKYDGIVNSVRN